MLAFVENLKIQGWPLQKHGDAVAGRKFSKIYIDHTVGSKKTNSGRESYDDFRTFYFLCMERYLFIRVIMP